MSTYNKQFQLSIQDIDLIERSVRYQIKHLASTEALAQTHETVRNHNKIVELMGVLGTLNSQKIWYSQAHRMGMPLG